MTTWNDVVEFVRVHYPTEQPDGEVLVLELRFREGRRQKAFVSRSTSSQGAVEWVNVTTPIGRVADLDLTAALDHAGRFACGGLVADRGLLLLRYSEPLAKLDLEELAEPLELVIFGADVIQAALTGEDRI